MSKLNVRTPSIKTHEGAKAKHINPEQQLRRSVMACMLWEDQFYEDGVEIAGRISTLVPSVKPEVVADMAIEARERMKLRHVPLLLAREMARHDTHKGYVSDLLHRVIQRADELTEFLAIYWKDGKCPLSSQVKRGLARAFTKFDEYQLAKYDRPGKIRLRDVLFLSHAKPSSEEQDILWKQLIDGTLPAPDTWEVALSSGGDKKEHWTRLLSENRLGAMALLRNLRNIDRAGVDEPLVRSSIENAKYGRVLPFRFIAAAKHVPQWEHLIEPAMLRSVESHEKLNGKTILLVDRSGSMGAPNSDSSIMTRFDAACGLAILIREICTDCEIWTFNNGCERIPLRRGFSLRDAMGTPYNGTYLGEAISSMNSRKQDRLIVITDEQSHDPVPDPISNGYIVNVASYRNGIGYGAWTHIDGWSEAIIDYIMELEREKVR